MINFILLLIGFCVAAGAGFVACWAILSILNYREIVDRTCEDDRYMSLMTMQRTFNMVKFMVADQGMSPTELATWLEKMAVDAARMRHARYAEIALDVTFGKTDR